MASAKTKRIYEAGAAAYKGSPPAPADRMLKAIALMLTEATKKRVVEKDKPRPQKLPFSPQALYELCLERVPHIIACEPYDKRWFGRLGKELQATSGLEQADLERFVGWVEGGGLEFFPDVTFAHVIKHWGTWIVKARSGGQAKQQGAGPESFMK